GRWRRGRRPSISSACVAPAPARSPTTRRARNRAARCSYLLEVTTRCEVVWEWRSRKHLDFATDIITLQDYRGRVDTRQYRGRTPGAAARVFRRRPRAGARGPGRARITPVGAPFGGPPPPPFLG